MKAVEAALRPRSLDCPMHNRHTHMHTNNAHPHPQTATNEHTKSSSELFNHKQKVAEGMPQGLVFNSISNISLHSTSRKDSDGPFVKFNHTGYSCDIGIDYRSCC